MMRGLAILLVIAVHVHQVIPGTSSYARIAMYGQMGVQLFFVASAFTLCNSYAYDRGKPHMMARFWIRRYFRIAPGYYFGIILYLIVGAITGFQRGSHTLPNILSNILLVNGLTPTGANNQVVPGGWSIGTEVLFYLLFPLLYSGYLKIRCKIWYYLVPPIYLGAFYSLIRVLYLFPSSLGSWHPLLLIANNSFSYFSIFNQLPVFLVGMSLWFLYTRGEFQRIKVWQAVIGAAVLNCAGVVFFFRNGATWQPFIPVPFVSALGMASIFVVLQRTKSNFTILKRVGLVSYSGYLLNALLIYVAARKLTQYLPFISGDIGLVVSYLVLAVLIVTLATFLHAIIERNGIRLGKLVVDNLPGR